MPGVLGGTTHKLTIDDAEALRRVPGVDRGGPGRHAARPGSRAAAGAAASCVYGVSHEAADGLAVRASPRAPSCRASTRAARGRSRRARRQAGPRAVRRGVAARASGCGSAAGRFLVIGVMEPKGQLLGFDLDDTAYIPVATAMDLFNLDELNEIDVVAASAEAIPTVVGRDPPGAHRAAPRRGGLHHHHPDRDAGHLRPDHRHDHRGGVAGSPGSRCWWGRSASSPSCGSRSTSAPARSACCAPWGSAPRPSSGCSCSSRCCSPPPAGCSALPGLRARRRIGRVGSRHAAQDLRSAVAAAVLMSLVVGAVSGVAPARRAASLDPIDALRAE